MAQGLRVEIIGDTRSYQRALKTATGATAKFGDTATKSFSALKVAAGVGIALAARAAVKGMNSMVNAASDMNETVSKVNTIFGKSGKEIEEWGEGLATTFAVSKQEALDAVAIFATFGKAAGLTGKELTNFSKPLVQAAADLASFHNVPVAQALEDIRSGLSGEVEPLRKYGILLNDAALRQEAMRLGLVKTTKEALEPANKMLASQSLILQKLGPAAGDAARTIGSAANQQKVLAAQAKNLSAELGGLLLPLKVLVLEGLNKAVSGLSNFVDKIGEAEGTSAKLRVIWEGVAGLGAKAFDALRTAVQKIDWGAVWSAVTVNVGRLLDKMHTALQNADWHQIGQVIGTGIQQSIRLAAGFAVKLTDELYKAVKDVDWNKVARGLSEGLFGADIGGKTATVLGKAFDIGWKKPVAATKEAADNIVHTFTHGFESRAETEMPKAMRAVNDSIEKASAIAAALAKLSGSEIGDAMATGIGDSLYRAAQNVAQAALALVNGVIAQMNKALETSSPSKVTYRMGKDVGEGLRIGLKKSLTELGPEIGQALLNMLGETEQKMKAGTKKISGTFKNSLEQLTAFAKAEGLTVTSGYRTVAEQARIYANRSTGGSAARPGMSYHNKGQAIDVAGSAAQMRKFFLDAWDTFGSSLKELFYDPIGWFVKNGRKVSGAIGGHSDHVHIAMESVKSLTDTIVSETEKSTPKISAAQARQIIAISKIMREGGKIIGMDHAREVIAGIAGVQPGIVAQARKAMQEAIAAARQAVVDARSNFKSAFASLANEALSEFDRVWSDWVPPSQKILDQMQLEDTINSAVKAVADAQAAVDAAVAARDTLTRTEGESDADFAERQRQAEADIKSSVESLAAAQRSYEETQLQLKIAQEQKDHEAAMERERKHLTELLQQKERYLKDHPKAYARVQAEILQILKDYIPDFNTAGYKLAHAFEEGLSEGLDAVIAAARKLADALEGVKKTAKGGGGGATNPGTAIGGGHGAGMAMRATGVNVTVNMPNYLGEPRTAAQQIRQELQKVGSNNALDPLATLTG